jgi:hypothetical protein
LKTVTREPLRRTTSLGLATRLFGGSPERAFALVRAAWSLAVGPELRRRTEVVGMEGRVLRVRVPDGRWRKELHRMQPELLRRLRDIAGELAPARLGFVDGGLAPQEPLPAPEAKREDPPPPPAVAAEAAAIEDEEIRARFLESAALYLGRGKGRSDA